MSSTVTPAERLSAHLETISPGLPYRLGDHNSIGDMVVQGDLMITVVEHQSVPEGYELVQRPTDADRQLVPDDGGPGSHHRLASLDGVTLYRPRDWGADSTDYAGPLVIFDRPNAIPHEAGANPHGTVYVDSAMSVLCEYQRNLSVEGIARRARD